MHNYVDKLCEWAGKEEDIHLWPLWCETILEQWGWNPTAAKDFSDWGSEGYNNLRLHFEDGDEDPKNFWSEVLYCSDRMSLDRLLRCNYYFYAYKKSLETLTF